MKQDNQLSALDLKSTGNKFYFVHRFEEAITYYSRAIMRNPNVPTFFSNRALCHLKLQQWPQAIQDCRRALDIEPNLIKAHFFLGQALSEAGNYDEAMKHLQRAHDLAKERKQNFGDDIAYQIRLLKKKRWSIVEEKRINQEVELQTYLNRLIQQDKERRIQELRESQSGSPSSTFSSSAEPHATAKPSQDMSETDIIHQCDNYADELNKMFSTIDSSRKARDVPDYLCGKISFEIMRDPVITPSGITYDRKDIEEHLQRVGHFDPITRQPLKSDQLIPNLAIKEVVDVFLSENEWASYS